MLTTLAEVAERAGVSIATVSHAINGTRPVSEPLRQAVYSAMEALDYRPNRLARSLRRGTTKTVGMIVPDSANPFFAEIARGIEAASFEHGYNVILCNSEGDPDKELLYVRVLVEGRVDGILFVAAGVSTEALITTLRSAQVPVVVTDRDIKGTAADRLAIDNVTGGQLATEHLLSLGHRRIACITGAHQFTPSAGRITGYRRTLIEHRVPVEEDLVVRGDWQCRSGAAATRHLLGLPEPPTAIFVCNDMMAIGAISAATALGRRVPQDLSIVGFDDIGLASYAAPPLTTVRQPRYEMGTAAFRMLLERMQDPELAQRNRTFEVSLIIRASTAAASGQPGGG